jgi:hypothetical protein
MLLDELRLRLDEITASEVERIAAFERAAKAFRPCLRRCGSKH